MVASLNVYEDNRVGLISPHQWAWTSERDAILGLEVDGDIYNAKDVDSLRRAYEESTSRNKPEVIVIALRDGRKITAEPQEVKWLRCDGRKRCSDRDSIVNSDYRNKMGGILTAVPKRAMERPDTIQMNGGDPRTALIEDYRSRPTLLSVGESVIVVSGTELDKITEKVSSVIRDWDNKANDRREIAAAKDIYRKAAADTLVQQLTKARIGTQTYCESNATSNPDLRSSATVNCPGYGATSIDQLTLYGWNVVNHNVRTGTDAGGVFTFYTHGITVQKVR